MVPRSVKEKTDIIVVRGTPAAIAAKSVGVPIDHVRGGGPAVGRPGGESRQTGRQCHRPCHAGARADANRIAVLKEMLPKAERIGNLLNLSNPTGVAQWKETESAIKVREMEPVLLDVREPKHFAEVFEAAVAKKVDALLVSLDPLIVEHRRAVAEFAAKHSSGDVRRR